MTAWGAGIAGSVLNGTIEGVALAALLWMALRLAPRASAATRYALCGLAMAFVAALPLAQAWLPRLGEPSPAAYGAHAGAALTLTAGAWLSWALAAWAMGSLALLARVGRSLTALGRLKRRASAAPQPLAERFEGIMRACPGRRRARVLVSAEVGGPVAAGLARPAVLLPAAFVDELSEAELDQVLAHELAHLRRGDDWTNLAQKVVEALLFFHPAVLWIGRRLTLEREIACDDWVVGLTGTARPYASCLTRLAAIRRAAPQLAPAALARRPQLSLRVEALLESGRDRGRRSSRGALAAAGSVLAIMAYLAAPLAPVTVEMPRAQAAVRKAPAAVAQAAPAYEVVKVARVHPRRVVRTRALARNAAPLAAQPAIQAPALARNVALPVPRPAIQAPAPAMTLYVVYVDGGDAGWIRILWVHAVPVPPLDHT
jgi:beta-lactamase regulating signal transducer with metallopeptidase domain